MQHLRTFLAIAESGSLVRAAGKLNVTQPAVTKILAELEADIGQPLVERTRQGIVLTASGHILLSYATRSLRTLQEGLDSVAETQLADAPVIRIGALPNVGATVLPAAVRGFVVNFPTARLRISTGSNALLLASLRQGRLDLVIGRLGEPADMQGLAFEQLYTEPLVFVSRPDHPLAVSKQLPIAELGRFQLLLPDAGTRVRAIADEFLLSSGMTVGGQLIETIDTSFGRAFILESDAIWCVPFGVIARDVADGLLARLPIATETMRGPVGVTQRADSQSSVAIQSFVEEIRLSATSYHARIE